MEIEKTEKVSSHCRLDVDDIVGGHQVVSRLGCGRASTVWKCQSGEHNYAIKVFRSDEERMKEWKNEVKMLTILGNDCEYVVGYYGAFAHTAAVDDAPVIYPCIVMDVAGCSLNKLLKYMYAQDGDITGLSTIAVKKIMRDVFSGLAFIHSRGIVHCDIKPGNILLNLAPVDVTPDNVRAKIADVGSSYFASAHKIKTVGTTGYMAPEILVKRNIDYPIDIWSAFVMCYELIVGDYLFDIFEECDVSYGEDIDCEEVDLSKPLGEHVIKHRISADLKDIVMSSEDDDTNSDDDENSSDDDSSGDEIELNNTTVKYRNLLFIAKVIGFPPKKFVNHLTGYAVLYFDKQCVPIYNTDMVPISIGLLLQNNYDMEGDECDEIEKFLLNGLKYTPENRVTAEEALKLDWLKI